MQLAAQRLLTGPRQFVNAGQQAALRIAQSARGIGEIDQSRSPLLAAPSAMSLRYSASACSTWLW